jgi:hypothetical protein
MSDGDKPSWLLHSRVQSKASPWRVIVPTLPFYDSSTRSLKHNMGRPALLNNCEGTFAQPGKPAQQAVGIFSGMRKGPLMVPKRVSSGSQGRNTDIDHQCSSLFHAQWESPRVERRLGEPLAVPSRSYLDHFLVQGWSPEHLKDEESEAPIG